jgi:gamma-glutamyltranspeptidase/glutathione hydrolase
MRGGGRAFYRGTIARRIVDEMAGRGLLTNEDLARYRAIWRPPVTTTYKGTEVFAMGPPTSGGVVLAEMLNLLEPLDLRSHGLSSANALHLVGEAQRIAWADRNEYLADPGFVRQPTATLVSKAYAERRRADIALERTRAQGPGDVAAPAPGSTTHVSVIDRAGNAVALTCTIEQEFGSAVAAPGTGFLLNNELTDFGPPGTANEAAPFKRPRSSMSPTIVVRNGRPALVTGGAGGSLIIMGVVQAVLNTVEFGLDVPRAIDHERVDNQGAGALRVEEARIDPAVLADLEGRGWSLVRQGEYGARPRIQAAGMLADGRMVAVSDPRADDGSLAVRPRRPVACVPVPGQVRCPPPPARR